MEIDRPQKDIFDLERGRAIDAFAKVEGSLCWVMVEAGKIDHETGSIIFYANISMQPRVEIVTAIVEAGYADQFKMFWDSVVKMIESLTKQRNKIVHWHGYPVSEGAAPRYTGEVLIHPVVGRGKKLSEVSIDDLRQFSEKATYTAKVLNAFSQCFNDRAGEAIVQREIARFSQAELKFPPPAKDPFFSS
ncbi:hypothetical protein B0G75_102246 [Paraburkholderia sp. BL18I3N2]|uniref:hypothetical protein n=1 Tax=Paraburkholderia sp. BL18I3N2 TaxID=1938799 RepID=UPI000D058623|nr:hypothetical protein [Paraburkholderia sp. BL18I3N2]PRX34217.1 hypothetical protein B0G75_102246 [Paraburkholderia sp. BL18I3N2]